MVQVTYQGGGMDGVTSNAASEATLQLLLKALGGSGGGAGAGGAGGDDKAIRLKDLIAYLERLRRKKGGALLVQRKAPVVAPLLVCVHPANPCKSSVCLQTEQSPWRSGEGCSRTRFVPAVPRDVFQYDVDFAGVRAPGAPAEMTAKAAKAAK